MKRILIIAVLLITVFSSASLAGASLVVGIERSTKGDWEGLADRFAARTGIELSLKSYPQSSIAQQIVIQGFYHSGKHNLCMVPRSWGTRLSRYLVDLSDVVDELNQTGIEPVSFNGVPLGVSIPFAPDWFLAVLAWPDDRESAVQLLIAVAGGESSATPATGTTTDITISFRTEKIPSSEHNPKIDGALEVLLVAAQTAVGAASTAYSYSLPSSVQSTLSSLASLFGIPFSAGTSSVTVVLESRPGRSSAENVASLSALGVSRSSIEAGSGLVKVTVPLSQLSTLASQLSGVAFIRPPYRPHTLGTPSEGTGAIGADAYHAAGITGSGVKIAVIDLGFAGLSQAQARGDLPYSVVQNDLTGSGLTSGTSHGTAVAEVIHDIAPDAQLHLIKIADEVDLDLAVTYCLNNGIDIINHSLGWYNTNFYDGTGTIPDIARRATNGGILWVNAAGNEAQSHWEGTFVDSNSDGLLDRTITFYATSGSSIVLYLTWNEWPYASTDYDLYLYDPSSNLIASSTKHQTGTEEPTEAIQLTASQSGMYTVKISGSGSRRVELYSLYQTISPAIASSSILAPANAADVVAVGAIDYSHYTTGPQEPYSSQGPTNDGRTKPDLCAPDNVTTGTVPYTAFPGTSASAPQVSGAAALLLSAEPGLSGAALRARLLSQTIPMGSANIYGQGRLYLEAPSQPNQGPTASFTFSPAFPQVGTTVSFDGSGSHDPDGSIVSYTWDFGDGGSGSGMTASHAYAGVGTYTVRLTVYDDDGASGSTSTQIQVQAQAIPDLTVTGLNYSPSSPTLGTQLSFSITLQNIGSGSSSWFRVLLQGASSSTYTYISQLAAGASRTITLSVPLSASAETFTVTVDDLNGVSESNETNNTRAITVYAASPPPPVADAGGPYSGTAGVPMAFDGSDSTGAITTYIWSFGDGSSAQGISPTHTYANPGTYTVTLTVYGTGGQSTDSTQVAVSAAEPALSAQLYLPKASYEVDEAITITYITNRTAYVYLCEASPDGRVVLLYPNMFEQSNPVSAGTHTVPGGGYTLRVSEPTGTESLYLFAATSPLPNFPTSFGYGFPVLSYDPGAFRSSVIATMQSQVPAGDWAFDTLSFTITAPAPTTGALRVTSSPSGAAVTLDGAPFGTTPVEHGGIAPGTHTVHLTKAGYSDETRQVTITAGMTTSLNVPLTAIPSNQPPHAEFSFSPASPTVGDAVTFDASGSSDSDGSIISYAWDFGDGSTASGATTSHTFVSSGTYAVRLTVTDDDGDSASADTSLSVTNPGGPAPSFPPIDVGPGIYVWGTDAWHITVKGDPAWTTHHAFEVGFSSDQPLTSWTQSVGGGASPVTGLPSKSQRYSGNLTGAVTNGTVDIAFSAPNSETLSMRLKFDFDGDGRLDQDADFVFLVVDNRAVHPPLVPLLIGLPRDSSSPPLTPSMNYRLGKLDVRADPPIVRWLFNVRDYL